MREHDDDTAGHLAPGVAAAMREVRRVQSSPDSDARVRTGRLAGGPRRVDEGQADDRET